MSFYCFPESNISRCGFRGSSHIGIPYSTKVLPLLIPHCFLDLKFDQAVCLLYDKNPFPLCLLKISFNYIFSAGIPRCFSFSYLH